MRTSTYLADPRERSADTSPGLPDRIGACRHMTMPTEHLWNSDFDFRLSARGQRHNHVLIRSIVAELSLHVAIGASPGDSVISPRRLTEPFRAYWIDRGISVPDITDRMRPEHRLHPFGWSREMMEQSRSYANPRSHPPLEIIQRVNGRRFARSVEQERLDFRYPGEVLTSLVDLAGFLERNPSTTGWMMKGEHGNAGLSNRRLRNPTLGPADRRVATRLLKEDGRILIEPWFPREMDITGCFDLDTSGKLEGLTFHRVENTSDGALLGIHLGPDPGIDPRWLSELGSVARTLGSGLHQEGYFGPVCFDAFIVDSEEGSFLRPVSDINAHESMSWPIRRFIMKLHPGCQAHWRFFNRQKLRLTGSLQGAISKLGGDDFDPGLGEGILFTNPLESAGAEGVQPHQKIGVLFMAESEDAIRRLEATFRDRFHK